MEQDKKRSRRKFSDQFKRDAAALVIATGRPVVHVAEIGVSESSLGRWVAQERANRGETDDLSTGERERLRKVADLRMEPDLLKRSVALWVQETSTRVRRYRGVDDQKAEGLSVTRACGDGRVDLGLLRLARRRPPGRR